MTTLKNIMKISSIFIGTVLGAGFASGQVILKFFTIYGMDGIYGLVLSGVMFFFIGWAVLELLYMSKATSFKVFIQPITGTLIGTLLEWSVLIFMFISFGAMLAGTGALLEQKFGWTYQMGVVLMALVCYFTFLFGIKGIVFVNAVFAPVLLIGCFMLGMYIWFFKNTAVFYQTGTMLYMLRNNWLSSTWLYVAYNTVTTIVVLTTLHKYNQSKKVAIYSALVSAIALGVLGVALGVITLVNYHAVQGVEIPMLTIVMQYAPAIQYIYLVVIVAAMFTTAVANGYGLIAKVESQHKGFKQGGIILLNVAGIAFAQIGFSKVVERFYPLFGYIGLFELLLILLYFIRYKTNEVKSRIANSFGRG